MIAAPAMPRAKAMYPLVREIIEIMASILFSDTRFSCGEFRSFHKVCMASPFPDYLHDPGQLSFKRDKNPNPHRLLYFQINRLWGHDSEKNLKVNYPEGVNRRLRLCGAVFPIFRTCIIIHLRKACLQSRY